MINFRRIFTPSTVHRLMPKFSITLFVALLLASCQQTPAPPTVESPDAKNLELIQTYFKHFNAHDWQKMAAMYREPAEMKDPAFGLEMIRQTRAEIVGKYQELNQAIPDVRDSILSIYPSGKHVVVEFISSGTAPDSSKFTLPICTVFTIENGLITQDFTYYDNF